MKAISIEEFIEEVEKMEEVSKTRMQKAYETFDPGDTLKPLPEFCDEFDRKLLVLEEGDEEGEEEEVEEELKFE